MDEILDHLIVGCSDLFEGIAQLEQLSGFCAVPGGSHPGRGTCNALLKLGPHAYLEILAPDPAQPELTWFRNIREFRGPHLIGYALRHENLDELASDLRSRGIACRGPVPGQRTRSDGQTLRWRTLFYGNDQNGLLPFYIEWDPTSPHPSEDAPGELALVSFDQGNAREGHLELRARLRGRHGEFALSSVIS